MGDVSNQPEKNVCGFHKIVRIKFVGSHKNMDAETLDAFIPADAITLKELVARKSVLGLFGVADDHIAFL